MGGYMKKNAGIIIVIFLYILHGSHHILDAHSETKKAPQEPIELIINLNNNNQQTANVQNANCLSCAQCFGTTLKECMASLSNEEFKKTFFGINAYARKEYLDNLTIKEHTDVLFRFTEQEWHEEREKLTSEQKKFLPKTIAEQRAIIKEAHKINQKAIDTACRSLPVHAPMYENHPCGENRYIIAIQRQYERLKKDLLRKYTQHSEN